MQTLAILSNKGGTGKTTLATHLSVEAQRHGHRTVLVDLDPQASAFKWGDHRELETPEVIATPSTLLAKALKTAETQGATLVIVDTAPTTDPNALNIARAADMVLIPCKPSLLDIEAIEPTIHLVDLANATARIVLNIVPARSHLGDQARRACEIYDVPCLPSELGSRVGFVHAYNHGMTVQEYQPKSKSSLEIQAVYADLATLLEI